MTESALPKSSSLETPPLPWTFLDTWIGLGLFLLVYIGTGVLVLHLPEEDWILTTYLLVYQPLQFLPILAYMLYRRASLADLGFRRGQPNVLALGCGLFVVVYGVSMVNNLAWALLGVDVQAQDFASLMSSLDQPAILLVTGSLFAPLFEEAIIRGYLFAGLRQKWGWLTAALVSSAIFGVIHLSISAFIPTFLMGFLFCYLYHRSNSLWPGIILHTLVNSFSLCTLLAVVKYVPNLL